ncbi:MAG TPA: thioredoxin domain-containing protein, partial [Phycisphaerae bacterium]|nr:thioredoxin domain-containing protein [Phycisphaerae bacterium]
MSDPAKRPRACPVVAVLASALILAGWGCSAVLLAAHLDLAMAGGLALRICSGDSDCATVLKSPQAVQAHLPLAAWGMLYFSALGGGMIVLGLPRRRSAKGLPLVAALTAGTVVSVVCLHWMAHTVKAFCPWCSAAHAANFLLAAVVLVGWWVRRRPGRAIRPVAAVIVPLVLLGELALLVWAGGPIRQAHRRLHGGGPGRIEEIARAWREAPASTAAVLEDDLTYGPAGAPHTLVMFSDFRCPYCRESHEAVKGLVERMAGRLRVAVKQFPFHPSCNPSVLVERPEYARSCPAARAAVAAREAGGADAARRYAELLYQAPEDAPLDDARLGELAEGAGIDPSAWRAAYTGPAAAERLRRDLTEGARLNIAGVPAFFLDGRRLEDVLIPDGGSGEIDWAGTMELWRRLLG